MTRVVTLMLPPGLKQLKMKSWSYIVTSILVSTEIFNMSRVSGFKVMILIHQGGLVAGLSLHNVHHSPGHLQYREQAGPSDTAQGGSYQISDIPDHGICAGGDFWRGGW